MATRTRLAGSTSVQYENFAPKYEWKEEQEANVLHVHLPDFQKEQIKITYVHSSRTIRVLGERLVSSNKWKRFNQVFAVPQNCEVSKIQGRFQDGVLIITMPKTIVTQPVPREEAKASKEASTSSRTALSPKTSTTEPKAGRVLGETVDPKPSSSTEAKAGKVLDETAGFASQKQKDGKKVEETLGSKDSLFKESKSEKGADTTEKIRAVSDARAVDQTEQRNQREKQLLEQEEISKKIKESLITKSDEGIKKRQESVELEKNADVMTSQKEKKKGVKFGVGEEKPKKDAIVEKVKGVKDAAAASAKKTVKGFMELSEEKKSMVNMGVAALVIVALGAYIAYSFRSSGNNTENQ